MTIKSSAQRFFTLGSEHAPFLGVLLTILGAVAWASARIRGLEDQVHKERELRDKDLHKERELRERDVQAERELRAEQVQKERELRQAVEARIHAEVRSHLFQILHHADYEGAVRDLRAPPPSTPATKP